MGNRYSEYLSEADPAAAAAAAKPEQKQIASENVKREVVSEQRQRIDSLMRDSQRRDAGMLTAHLPKVNPLTRFTVAEHTGLISPPTRGQSKDPRGLPNIAPITETPAFLQPADRNAQYLDTRSISNLRKARQISFV